jgi:hypothetical protein
MSTSSDPEFNIPVNELRRACWSLMELLDEDGLREALRAIKDILEFSSLQQEPPIFGVPGIIGAGVARLAAVVERPDSFVD